MEHREPPPDAAEGPRIRSAAPAASGRLALPPPDRPRAGRPGIDRSIAAIGSAILLGGLLCGYLIYRASRSAQSWLGDQPAYQLPFGAIVLDPPCPPGYRGGAAGFLENVRRRANLPETIPLLKLEEGELKRAFESSSPWVEKVQGVTYRPFGVTVRLAYRRPVAVVETSTHHPYLVDASAIILPAEELEADISQWIADRRVIEINGDGLADPRDPRHGLPWQLAPGALDAAPGNGKISAAARMAAFLLDHLRSIDRAREPALSFRLINPMDRHGRGLFLVNEESHSVLWGDPPGEEPPGGLTAEEKWEKLREWGKRERSRREKEGDYWEITPGGVVYHVTSPLHPRSALVGPPRQDRATIPAKAPGQSGESLSP